MGIDIAKNINIGIPPQMKSSKNSLMEVGLLIVICGLFIWFIILPKMAELNLRNADLQKYSDQEKDIKNNLNNLNKLVADLKKHDQDIKTLDYALPLEGKDMYLQILLQNLADSSGVTVQDINVTGKSGGVVAGDTALIADPFAPERTLQKLSGSIYVTGTFQQLEAFLKKMEASGRIIQVSVLDIEGTQDSKLNLKVTVDAYYLAP